MNYFTAGFVVGATALVVVLFAIWLIEVWVRACRVADFYGIVGLKRLSFCASAFWTALRE